MNENIKVSLRLEGADALRIKLSGLNDKVHKRIVARACRSAMSVFMDAAKMSAQGTVGGDMGRVLANGLAIRKQRTRLARFVYAVTCSFNVRGSSKAATKRSAALVHISRRGRRTFIPAAIEYGHGRNEAGSAIPFMRSAFRRMQEGMIAVLSESLGRQIEEEGRR